MHYIYALYKYALIAIWILFHIDIDDSEGGKGREGTIFIPLYHVHFQWLLCILCCASNYGTTT